MTFMFYFMNFTFLCWTKRTKKMFQSSLVQYMELYGIQKRQNFNFSNEGAMKELHEDSLG